MPDTRRSFVSFRELPGLAGRDLGESDWITIGQERINQFADATGDHQWIHVDVERARVGPFGGTIAHGYLTLALAPALLFEMLEVGGADQVINYGLGKVRFPSPVPAGGELRLRATCRDVEEVAGGYQLVFSAAFELRGAQKPACIADIIFRYYGPSTSDE
ncbi:MaoC family dehydratase [Mycolicibacterium sp.]|uniref:MaoC family dehydratase n=1 Tax=Mycolicibacterium sp. TaxID=2320850 RepID=UPI0037C67910